MKYSKQIITVFLQHIINTRRSLFNTLNIITNNQIINHFNLYIPPENEQEHED